MRAIVFSGGALFGAYHIGAWKVLSPHFQPDLVVGASVGSLFGYMIASGQPIKEIEREWLSGERYAPPRLRLPRSPFHGWLDPDNVHGLMQDITTNLKPQIPFATVALTFPRMKPVIFQTPDITWRHLAAACALPLVFDAQRIDGRLLIDGGLLNPCPVNIARDLGATEIIGLNCLRGGSRRVAANSYVIGTPWYLGSPRSSLVWNRANIERWIAAGERDATTALRSGEVCAGSKTFAPQMFQ